MKIRSNQPELDDVLNQIWADFSITDDTTLVEALRLCYSRVRLLEAIAEQDNLTDEIFSRQDDDCCGECDDCCNEAAEPEPDLEGECNDPNCLLCAVRRKLAAKLNQ